MNSSRPRRRLRATQLLPAGLNIPSAWSPLLKRPVFTAMLGAVAKTWKQPVRPLTDEWTKMWCVYTMEYYSAIKQNEIMPFTVTWMDLEIK